jgi:hypothetical protein
MRLHIGAPLQLTKQLDTKHRAGGPRHAHHDPPHEAHPLTACATRRELRDRLATTWYAVVSAGSSTGDRIIMNMTIGIARSITSSTFFREADGGICIFNSPRNVARFAPG